jgi:TolB-like protein/DNA-binding winged helix-turn-helix (wHTH) protein/Tfp pilus assembly protein PilF
MTTSGSGATYRFGDFSLDVGRYELRHNGRPVRLERQPMDLLILMVERRSELVSRSEIIDRLWGKDVFVDVETGIHTAVRKIRQVLRDSPEAPSFIETVSGKGYRFIAAVDVAPSSSGSLTPQDPAVVVPRDTPGLAQAAPSPARPIRGSRRAPLMIAGSAVAAMAVLAIWAWPGADRAGSLVTVAVLPFENLSGNPDSEYLADGLTEETIASLGQIDPDRVSVVSRTSVMAYKRTNRSASDIGRELDADYLLEGSIREETGRLRITANLIRVSDQVQLWSQSYNRAPTSMLGFQQELSAALAEQIQFRLSPDRLEALSRRQPRNADAYDLYLRGQTFANLRTPSTTEKAVEYFRRATALDPEYALAWSGLAMAYAASPVNGDADPLKVWPRASAAAGQAVRADPALAEAQFASGYLNWMFEWNWPAAEAEFRRAVDLDPRNAQAHWVLGHSLSQMGRHSEAIPMMRRARELEPLNAMAHALSSQVAFQARDYPAALNHASQALALDPEFWVGHMMRGQAYEQLGRDESALEALTTASRFSGTNSKAMSLRGYVLGKLRRVEEARHVAATLESTSHTRYIPPYALALVHAGLGNREAVFEWLARALTTRDVHLIYLPVDPKWDAYVTDPRFQDLLARCDFLRVGAPR